MGGAGRASLVVWPVWRLVGRPCRGWPRKYLLNHDSFYRLSSTEPLQCASESPDPDCCCHRVCACVFMKEEHD